MIGPNVKRNEDMFQHCANLAKKILGIKKIYKNNIYFL